MTQEVIDAYEKCKNSLLLRRPGAEWKVLFDYYNDQPGHRRLGMGCRSCYSKVLAYVAIQITAP